MCYDERPDALFMLADQTRDDVARYFDESIRFYHVFWHGSTGALHFGMRGGGGRGHRAELLNTNQVLSNAVDVQPGERVLDAGCGVGGSSLWLARGRGAQVLGITISERQLEQARASAVRLGLQDSAVFELRDYTRTGLPDAGFDIVWALESACYAADKKVLLSECHRLLRPGGRLVVADGFLARPASSPTERALYAAFQDGLLLPELPSVRSFLDAARSAGFTGVSATSHLRELTPSCRRLFAACLATYPLALLARRLGRIAERMVANSRAGIALYPLVALGIVDYCVMVARKPEAA
jgi:cyclopropane fatty-acyl-phospholipid synthase-like methyltransferase